MATAFVWDGTSNVWASDHWGRGGVSPKWPGDTSSTTSDTVSITTATAPTNGAASSLTILTYTCSESNFGITTKTSRLTATTVTIGTSAGSDTPQWNGTCTGTITCNGASSMVTGTAVTANFHDTSSLVGTSVSGNVNVFSTGLIQGTIGGNCLVYVANTNYAAAITGNILLQNATASLLLTSLIGGGGVLMANFAAGGGISRSRQVME